MSYKIIMTTLLLSDAPLQAVKNNILSHTSNGIVRKPCLYGMYKKRPLCHRLWTYCNS